MNSALPSIYVTRRFPGSGIEKLQHHFDVTINKSSKVLSPTALKKAVKGADAIVSLLTDIIDAEVMDAAGPQLRLIANYAVGFDNIDLIAAKERNIIVTNTPGVLTEAVAEHTFALIMALTRRIVEADRFTRWNEYKQWEPDLFLGMQLSGKTLGLIGLGRIGAGVVKMAQGFGLKTIYFDEIRHKDLEKEYGVEYHRLETILKQSDIVSLHVPLLPTTKHLIGAEELKMIKPSAYLINTARGPIVNESALIHALTHKQIAGAGLDVFEHEPKIDPRLFRLSNVILTPHIGSATAEAREMMSQIVADNCIAFFDTGKALNPAS